MMTYTVLAEDYSTWSTWFLVFAQSKDLFKKLTDTELTARPALVREYFNDERMRKYEGQTQTRAKAVQENKSRKNQI